MKVDITHPGQLLAVLKAIGPAQLEENFGAGRQDKNAMRGRIPVRPTSIVQTIRQKEETLIEGMDGIDEQPLKGIKVVMGTTDCLLYTSLAPLETPALAGRLPADFESRPTPRA